MHKNELQGSASLATNESSKILCNLKYEGENGPNHSDSDGVDDELSFTSEISSISDSDEEKCESDYLRPSLKGDLASFVVRRGTPVSHVNEFLNILHKHKDNPNLQDLPRSHNSLMQTSKNKIEVRSIPTKPSSKSGPTTFGSLYYRGIATALTKRKELIKDLDRIIIDIGIDGANKYVSSKLTIWPIIGDIVNSSKIRPFLIGKYILTFETFCFILK